jgi:hypothetical protein
MKRKNKANREMVVTSSNKEVEVEGSHQRQLGGFKWKNACEIPVLHVASGASLCVGEGH